MGAFWDDALRKMFDFNENFDKKNIKSNKLSIHLAMSHELAFNGKNFQ